MCVCQYLYVHQETNCSLISNPAGLLVNTISDSHFNILKIIFCKKKNQRGKIIRLYNYIKEVETGFRSYKRYEKRLITVTLIFITFNRST